MFEIKLSIILKKIWGLRVDFRYGGRLDVLPKFRGQWLNVDYILMVFKL